MKKSIDAILFDFDGTLVDSRRDIVESVNHTLRTMGKKEKSFETVVSYIGTGVRDLLRQVLESDDTAQIEEGVRIFSDYFRAHANDHSRLYPGVKAVLEHFKDKTLLIVTNRRRALTEGTLKALGIEEYFKDIIGGDDEHCLKPSGCPINRILSSRTYLKERCLMVGDMHLDVKTGRDAGILTCAVTYGVGKRPDIEGSHPDYIIDHIMELQELFD